VSDTTTTYEPVKAGTMFSASWGYDQTNVDFYEVVSISKSGLSVMLQEVGQHRQTDGQGPHDRVVPDRRDKKGKPFRRKLHVWPSGCGVSINSYTWASPWDGTPRSQTGIGWGH
jgi:hypothetical protein